MKTLKILFFLTLFALTACNGSTTTLQQVPYSDPALVAKVDALTKALAQATNAQAQQAEKFSRIQLSGPSGSDPVGSHIRTNAVGELISFGGCTDSGIKVGSSGTVGLDEQTQVFKQTPSSTCPGVYSEYDTSTGNLHTIHRIYYTTVDCTGTAYIWDAGGEGIDRQKAEAGVSFISPNPTDNGQMWVVPGMQPQIIQAVSAFVVEAPGCVIDGDIQPMWIAVQTNTQTSGVALNLGIDYQIKGL